MFWNSSRMTVITNNDPFTSTSERWARIIIWSEALQGQLCCDPSERLRVQGDTESAWADRKLSFYSISYFTRPVYLISQTNALNRKKKWMQELFMSTNAQRYPWKTRDTQKQRFWKLLRDQQKMGTSTWVLNTNTEISNPRAKRWWFWQIPSFGRPTVDVLRLMMM